MLIIITIIIILSEIFWAKPGTDVYVSLLLFSQRLCSGTATNVKVGSTDPAQSTGIFFCSYPSTCLAPKV